MNNIKDSIGFWGYPHPDLIQEYKLKYPNAKWIDLDVEMNAPNLNIYPKTYCQIIKNIINNTFFLKESLICILAPIGKDKCDSAWLTTEILKDYGFNIITSKFEEFNFRQPISVSTSSLSLIDKINAITSSIIEPFTGTLTYSKPKFGFWGVPPNDFEILKLFPNNTHIYGWLRCVEAKVPADIELEMFVDKDVPTVFYAQAFCSKTHLAKFLADKYNGLYLDIDDKVTNSVKAKVEAFLNLR